MDQQQMAIRIPRGERLDIDGREYRLLLDINTVGVEVSAGPGGACTAAKISGGEAVTAESNAKALTEADIADAKHAVMQAVIGGRYFAGLGLALLEDLRAISKAR